MGGVLLQATRTATCPSTPLVCPAFSRPSRRPAPSSYTHNYTPTPQIEALPVANTLLHYPRPVSRSQRAWTLQERAGEACRAAQARAQSNEWRKEKEDKKKELLKVSMNTMPTPRLRAGGWYVPRQNEPVRAQLVRETTPGLLYEGEGEREREMEKKEELEVLKSTGRLVHRRRTCSAPPRTRPHTP